MHNKATNTCKPDPTPEEIAKACAAIQAVHRAEEKAGRGNHAKRRPTNIRKTSAGSGRLERGAT